MGEQAGTIRLPDIFGELDQNEDPKVWRLAERIKIALDLLNSVQAVSGGGIYYNFLSFGGIADGVTNNTPALNTLITTVTAAGGGVIYFPEGVYGLAATVISPDDCKITFLGDGQSSILSAINVAASPMFNIGRSTVVRDLNVDGAALIVSPLILIDSGNSVGLQQARYILNVLFTNTSATGITAIRFGNTQTFTGYGSIIHNCRFDLPINAVISQRFGADTIDNRRIFSGITANASSYIDLVGMNGVTIVGCDMRVPRMNSATNATNIVIAGNKLFHNGTWDVRAAKTSIIGNTLVGANDTALHATCVDLAFGPNSVDGGATITVNCFSASNNSVFFPRRGYEVTNTPGGGFTLGDGQLFGTVQWLGAFVSVQIGLQWGTTTTQAIPAAGFNFTLPTINGVNSLFGSVSPVGTGIAVGGGSFGLYGYCTPGGNRMLSGNCFDDSITTALAPIVPVSTNRYLYNLHYSWL